MTVQFQIPSVLRQYSHGRDELCLAGSTIGELLDELSRQCPPLYQCICNERGAVRQHLHLYINNDLVPHGDGMQTAVQRGDVVSVFQAVSGG
ncbi:MAG: MoaD/ThiS family protein [Pirellula sp.]